jgi:outer membrane immunogenic protein
MRRLVTTLLTGLSLTCLTCIAAVADGYVQQGPKDPPQTEKWTGMYFGLGIGAAMMQPDVSASGSRKGDVGICTQANCAPTLVPIVGLSNAQAGSMDLGDFGVLGTVQLGYDLQVSRSFVVGLFADLDWNNDLKAQSTNTANTDLTVLGGLINVPLSAQTLSTRLESDWSYSLGGRLGVLTDPRTMIYALAAYTHMKVKGSVTYQADDILGFIPALNSPTNITAALSDSLNGFTIGGGIETKLARNWSAKLEYRFTHLEGDGTQASQNTVQCCFGAGATGLARRIQDQVRTDTDLDLQSVRAVLSYRLN